MASGANSDYKIYNVEKEMNEPTSHLNVYIELIKLRKMAAVRDGAMELKLLNSNSVLGFTRFSGSSSRN